MQVLDYREGSEEVAVVFLRRRVWRSWLNGCAVKSDLEV